MAVTNATLSNQGGSSEESTNRLAFAAVVLAAGAFIVSFLQTVLEYLSSADSRNKCTYAAIGPSYKNVKFGWSWRFWRLRVYYPVLEFSFKKILHRQLLLYDDAIDNRNSPLSPIAIANGWNWQEISEYDRVWWNSVVDPFTKLVKSGEGSDIVTTKDLTWSERLTFYSWRLRHPFELTIRPRASWAQLLLAVGVRSTEAITYRHLDADLIPSSIDAPTQRVKLFDLGILALVLGFGSVKIDLQNRTFQATGTHGSITTVVQSDGGKFLRFEGDILAIKQQIFLVSPYILFTAAPMTAGKLNLGPNIVTNGYMCPLHLLPPATREGWDDDKFDNEAAKEILASLHTDKFLMGQIGAEAALFEELHASQSKIQGKEATRHTYDKTLEYDPAVHQKMYRTSTGLSAKEFEQLLDQESMDITDSVKMTCQKWQSVTAQRIPTIFAAASLALLSGAALGFPSRILINPFLPWIKGRASAFKLQSSKYARISQNLQSEFKQKHLGFVRIGTHVWMSRENIGAGANDLLYGWMYLEVKEIYDRVSSQLQDDIVIKDAENKPTGDVGAIVFPDALTLLENFDPASWKLKIEAILSLFLVKFQPRNLLWAQIVLLDVSIHYLIQGRWHDEKESDYIIWNAKTNAVIAGIVESWKVRQPSQITLSSLHAATSGEQPTTTLQDLLDPTADESEGPISVEVEEGHPGPSRASPPLPAAEPNEPWDWDLFSCLEKQKDLILDDDVTKHRSKVRQLAEMLELRALFTIAYFVLNTDSSDVYLCEGSEVELPMV